MGVNYKSIVDWFQNNEPIVQLNTENISNVNLKSRNLRNAVEHFIQDIPTNKPNKISQVRSIPVSNKRSLLTGQLADHVSQTYSSKSSLPASLSSSPHVNRKSDLSTSPVESRRTISSSQRSSSTTRQTSSMIATSDKHSREFTLEEKPSMLTSTLNSTSVLQYMPPTILA